MTNLTILPELKNLLPPLSKKEYDGLEKDILKNGCLSAIVAWNKTIVDGHNRYEICQKHGISFEVKQMEFDAIEDAMFWAWTHQENRRNLTPYQRSELALKFKPQIEKQARERQRGGKGGALLLTNLSKANEPINTRSELAKIADVSEGNIARVEFLDKHADEETKEKLRQGKTTINREYKQAKEKAAKPKTTRAKKTSEESLVAEPQREPENSEPSPSKNVPCIEGLTSDVRTTLKGIRQNHPDHLLINLNMHFRDGYIEELVIEAMAYLHKKKGEKVTTPIAKEIAKRYLKTKR